MTLRRIGNDANIIRPGQALFNTLLDVDPAFAESIRGTEYDCFHMDERIPLVLTMWRAHIQKQGLTPDVIPAKAVTDHGVVGGIPLKTLAHDEAIKNVKVKLFAYRDVLVIETVNPDDANYPGWTLVGPGKIGCVIVNTKTALGISEDALAWLKGVKRSRDDHGNVDWWACNDGTKAFAWLGGLYSIKERGADGSRNYEVFPDDYVPVPNNPSQDAMDAVDRKLGKAP